jgi:acylphosphatase
MTNHATAKLFFLGEESARAGIWFPEWTMGRFNGEMYHPITIMRMTAIARGRVQGVGYRYFVNDCAQESGITGFVRNQSDGTVMIVAEGNDEILDYFIGRIKAEGNPLIRVEGIEITKSKATGEFSGFGIRR